MAESKKPFVGVPENKANSWAGHQHFGLMMQVLNEGPGARRYDDFLTMAKRDRKFLEEAAKGNDIELRFAAESILKKLPKPVLGKLPGRLGSAPKSRR